MTTATKKKATPNKAVDWQSQLESSEIGRQQEEGSSRTTEFVYLKGLRRLAKLKGVVRERQFFGSAIVLKKPDGTEYPFVQMGYEVEFKDGEVWSDVADGHTYNINPGFTRYPTAIAASRAEARTLRKALGINMVSKEELGGSDASEGEMTNEITTAQVRVIQNLMKTKKIDNLMDVLKNATTREDVVDLKELTNSEARVAIKWLNKKKV
ncbi:MAG: hypothetical protein ACYTKD_16960 [Planctomycetota bacterium]|jgi:hypothetical protein